jgi:hypothetical protein
MTHMDRPNKPWWRYPMVWLVISGPAVVVVAGFATLAIAITHPDPVITTPPALSQPAALQQALPLTSFCNAAASRTSIWRCFTARMPSSWKRLKARLTVSSFRPR